MRHAAAILALALLSPGAGAQEKTFDSGGTKVAYLDEGRGEAVVLLHGFATSAEEMWTRMPCPSSPGFGRIDRSARAESRKVSRMSGI